MFVGEGVDVERDAGGEHDDVNTADDEGIEVHEGVADVYFASPRRERLVRGAGLVAEVAVEVASVDRE